MIVKLWNIVKFCAKYWWIFEPVGRFTIEQSKILYEKAKRLLEKPKKDKDKN